LNKIVRGYGLSQQVVATSGRITVDNRNFRKVSRCSGLLSGNAIFTYLFRLLFCFAAQTRAFRRAHQVQRNLATIRTHLASCLRGESLCGPPHRRKYPCQISKRTCTPLRWLPHRFNQQTFVVSECYTVRVRSLKSTSSCTSGRVVVLSLFARHFGIRDPTPPTRKKDGTWL
jgi:hypothetical protein